MSLESSHMSALTPAQFNSGVEAANLPIIELSFEDECRLFRSTNMADEAADIFIWEASEAGSEADYIPSFIIGKNGDLLQLVGLPMHHHDHAMAIAFDGQDTTILIDSPLEPKLQHKIVLENIDLTVLGQTDSEIFERMISQGNLDIVSPI